MCSWGHQMECKVMTSISSNRALIENSFDICNIKFKLDIFELLYREDAFNSRGPRFKTSHRQNLY